MYWAAWGGYPEVAMLLIEYGAGVHHELPIRGNGERGTTSLQEALAPSHWDEADTGEGPVGELRRNARQGKLAVAQILIDDGAHYDVHVRVRPRRHRAAARVDCTRRGDRERGRPLRDDAAALGRTCRFDGVRGVADRRGGRARRLQPSHA